MKFVFNGILIILAGIFTIMIGVAIYKNDYFPWYHYDVMLDFEGHGKIIGVLLSIVGLFMVFGSVAIFFVKARKKDRIE